MAIRTTSDTLTILDLCAGTGMFSVGVELALEAIGLDGATMGYVERESCAAASIVARMESTTIRKAPIWSDVKSIDTDLWRGCVDIVVAGYPCQPFSTSGQRRGESDPRHIWPDVRRAIKGIEPGIVFLENVSGHVSKGGGQVLCDLQEMGYRTTCGLFSSAETGANHRRERLFILGNTENDTRRVDESTRRDAAGNASGRGRDLADTASPRRAEGEDGLSSRRYEGPHSSRCGEPQRGERTVADTKCSTEPWTGDAGEQKEAGVGRCGLTDGGNNLPRYAPARNDYRAWAAVAKLDPARMPSIEPTVCGMADGVVSRTDRLRLTGNGVDPLVAAYAFITLSACLDG